MGRRVGETQGNNFHARQRPHCGENYRKMSQDVPNRAVSSVVSTGRILVTMLVPCVGVQPEGLSDLPVGRGGLPGESRQQQRYEHQREHCPRNEGMNTAHNVSLALTAVRSTTRVSR